PFVCFVKYLQASCSTYLACSGRRSRYTLRGPTGKRTTSPRTAPSRKRPIGSVRNLGRCPSNDLVGSVGAAAGGATVFAAVTLLIAFSIGPRMGRRIRVNSSDL